MNIESITIQNFRNIGEAKTYNLNKHFTAFIGVNGKGKSTILHALRIASGAYFLAIPDVKSRHIQKDEIRIDESGRILREIYPVKIEAKGMFPGSEFPIIWRRQWLEGSSSSTTRGADVGRIKEIAETNYQRITKARHEEVPLPVIAFFGISRAVGGGRVSKKSRSGLGKKIFHEGYQDWEEMRAQKFHYSEWLARYDALLHNHQKEYPGTKEAFFEAVKTANPYIIDIQFHDGELWLKVNIDGNESKLLPLSLLSDGIHYFTAMVAEIAYRCIVLNGYQRESAVQETRGIVMIDEIDLHLHPKWQRHVVGDLKKAFPHIQFVVTTHSPFIVQSLQQSELVNLDEDEQKPIVPNELPINKVITDIMDVDSIKSDDFETKYNEAKVELERIENSRSEKKLTMDDYIAVSKLLGNLLEEETDDAVYKAYIEKQKELDDETD